MSTPTIHPTAIIGPQTELGDNVTVGPYTIIEGEVFIDSGTQIGAHVYIDRYTHIGKNCRISPFAAIGTPPQDKRYQGGKNRGGYWRRKCDPRICHYQPGYYSEGRGKTQIGNQNLLMAYCHVAHDCQVGDGVVMANVATLAGHVTIGDFANLGGLAAVQPICSGRGLFLYRREKCGGPGYPPLCHRRRGSGETVRLEHRWSETT